MKLCGIDIVIGLKLFSNQTLISQDLKFAAVWLWLDIGFEIFLSSLMRFPAVRILFHIQVQNSLSLLFAYGLKLSGLQSFQVLLYVLTPFISIMSSPLLNPGKF